MSFPSSWSIQNKWHILFGLWALHGAFAFGQLLVSMHISFVWGIVLFGVLLFWILLNLFLLFAFFRKSAWLVRRLDSLTSPSAKDRIFGFTALMLFLLGCLGIFRSIADLNVFRFVGYINRLSPLLDLMAIVLSEIVVLILFFAFRDKAESAKFFKSVFAKFSIIVVLLGVIALYISQTGVGIQQIYKGDWARGLPAVPLLEWQILLAGIFCVGTVLAETNPKLLNISRLDLWIALFIWVSTAALWLSQPIISNSSALEPVAPNFQIYPFSDAQTYDEFSQSLLIGNEFGGRIPQRPLYIVFLTILHVITGQDYRNVIALQSLVFALFPVLLYLFGREFFGRPVGISVALLAALRDYTSNLVSPFTGNISYSKLYLSEIPTAMLLILFLWIGLRWIKAGFPNFQAFLMGGILGVAMLIRTQVAVAFPALFLFAFFAQPRKFLPIVKGAFLAGITVMLVVSPWLWRNWRLTGQLIFDNPESQMANLALRYNRLNGINVDILPKPDEANPEYNARLLDLAYTAARQNPAGIAGGIFSSFLNHGVDNILLFPLRNTLRDLGELWTPTEPFWQKWGGRPTASQSALLVFYTLLFGLGVGVAWHKNGWLGFLPLAVNLVYNLWTSIALLSGQRFLLAMDWSINLYYMIGLFALLSLGLFALGRGRTKIIKWCEVNAVSPNLPVKQAGWIQYVLAGVLFFGVGASLPLSEVVFPKKYQSQDQTELLSKVALSSALRTSSFDVSCFQKLIDENQLAAVQGRALYPRYYAADEGEAFTDSYGYKATDQGRLVFTLMRQGQSSFRVVFPADEPPSFFPHAADVILVNGGKQGVWFALVENETGGAFYVSKNFDASLCK
jgi:4-amino-4-deoxy-L-arabinose transferase-like glycosyltransferase